MVVKPNTDCLEVKGNFYIYKLNTFWQLLYYHDYSIEKWWASLNEAKKSYKANKYSVLYSINPSYKINNEYEFLLEYPGYTGYNQWCQTSNPLEEQEKDTANGKNAQGYRAKSVTWSFGGLVRSSYAKTLLDGSTYHSYTWFSIGRTDAYDGGVAGPFCVVQKSQLWIRVKKNPFLSICSRVCKRRIDYNQHIRAPIFILLYFG